MQVIGMKCLNAARELKLVLEGWLFRGLIFCLQNGSAN